VSHQLPVQILNCLAARSGGTGAHSSHSCCCRCCCRCCCPAARSSCSCPRCCPRRRPGRWRWAAESCPCRRSSAARSYQDRRCRGCCPRCCRRAKSPGRRACCPPRCRPRAARPRPRPGPFPLLGSAAAADALREHSASGPRPGRQSLGWRARLHGPRTGHGAGEVVLPRDAPSDYEQGQHGRQYSSWCGHRRRVCLPRPACTKTAHSDAITPLPARLARGPSKPPSRQLLLLQTALKPGDTPTETRRPISGSSNGRWPALERGCGGPRTA